MKRLTSILLAFIAITFFTVRISSAQNGTTIHDNGAVVTPQHGAEILFDKEKHDFGEVDEGGLATYDFIFTNTGDSTLALTHVQASCGCTTPEWTTTSIRPGERGKIKVSYNTKGRPGAFTKTVTVTSNAKTSPKVIFISGNVKAKPVEPTFDLQKPDSIKSILEQHP